MIVAYDAFMNMTAEQTKLITFIDNEFARTDENYISISLNIPTEKELDKDREKLFKGLMKELGIPDKYYYYVSQIFPHITDTVDLVILNNPPESLTTLLDLCSIPYIDISRKDVMDALLEHWNDVSGFITSQLNQEGNHPHGLCLSIGFIVF